MKEKELLERSVKFIFTLEIVLFIICVLSFVVLVVGSVYVDNMFIKILFIGTACIDLLLGIIFGMIIETKIGYYECGKCGHLYVPSYMKVLFAPHFWTTRYMRCEKCNELSWNKKKATNK